MNNEYEDATGATDARPARLASIDAYRGLVMFLMMAEVLHLRQVSQAFPDSKFWEFLALHQTHVEWIGCTLHDLIQPSFSFLVGVALPFSIASRLSRGQSRLTMSAHAFWRALVLVFLGVFLRSTGRGHVWTNFTFEDTLSQIGLGYPLLFLLGLRPRRDQWIAFAAILIGYWVAFVMYATPAGFEYAKVGVPSDWSHLATGFTAHWNKNANPAWAFDVWFLNLFPRPTTFTHNGGGYATLSFIPTLATMILGLLAGGVLRDEERPPGAKIGWFLIAGLIGLASGWALGELGVCPVVKRIWTPSWVLFSGGWCFLLLAAWHVLVDILPLRIPFFPLIVIGMNSIAAYCIAHLFDGFIGDSVSKHSWVVVEPLRSALERFGAIDLDKAVAGFEPLIHGAAVLFFMWLILLWMYRRRIFLRI